MINESAKRIAMPPTFDVLGVNVSATQIPEVIEIMKGWIAARDGYHWIAVTGMHGIVEALDSPKFSDVLNSADLVVPDGIPLIWLSRRSGFGLQRRVYGPELMQTFCRVTGENYRHFLCGGAEGVADRLGAVLASHFGVRIVGTYCPPFREMTFEEIRELSDVINLSEADMVWVGISTPRQEQLMLQFSGIVRAPVSLGVGAAFDFLSGTKRMAPKFVREHGLEWLYRLASEPRRLWRRYLIGGARFGYALARESRMSRSVDDR